MTVVTTPQEALARSVAALQGDALPACGDEDDAGWSLQWDGATWCRLPAGTPAPVDAFGVPLVPKPIGPGWYIGSRTQLHAGEHDPRGGICIDVYDVYDPATGEAIRTYVCVETHRRSVYRLEIPEPDIRVAAPASARSVGQALGDANAACVPKHSARAVCGTSWLAMTVIPVLARLLEDR